MPSWQNQIARQLSPVRPWFRQVTPATLRADAIAGLTNAAIVLPQGVAFALIAGLPPEYGLFTAMVPPVIAALWGSSMVMVSGPTTAVSAVLLSAVSELAPVGTPAYVSMALTLTIIVGIFQLTAGLVRLGGLVTFVSDSVITGFTATAAFLIAAAQLSGALGVTVEHGGSVFERIARVVEVMGATQQDAIILAGLTLAVVIAIQFFTPKLPGYLIALAVGGLAGWLINAQAAGVQMVGELPSILPSVSIPETDLSTIALLAPKAVAIAMIGLLQTISISRTLAIRRDEQFNSNQELVGQGLSNIVGGFFQAYASSGSLTRSGLNAESGAATPLSSLFASVALAAILFMVSPLVAYIPMPVMAGIILHISWRLIDRNEIRHIITASRSETLVLGLTFFTGILTKLDFAILIGVMASLSVFLYRSSHPSVAVGAPVMLSGRRRFKNAHLLNIEQCPQISNMRIEGPLFFASVEHVEHEFRKIESRDPGQKIKILGLKGAGKVDLSGADFLIKEIRNIRAKGGNFQLIAVFPDTVTALYRTKVIEVLGEDHLHSSKHEAVAAAVAEARDEICATCKVRAFLECAGKPAPEGVDPAHPAPDITSINSGQYVRAAVK